MRIENSIPRVTRLCGWCHTVILRDGNFYPHRTLCLILFLAYLLISNASFIIIHNDVEVGHLSRLTTKPAKWHVRPAKTQISLGIRPVWSESLLSAWRKLGSLATHWAHSEDSDQTGRMPRLIWVFDGRTVILLVSSWGRSSWNLTLLWRLNGVNLTTKLRDVLYNQCTPNSREKFFFSPTWVR